MTPSAYGFAGAGILLLVALVWLSVARVRNRPWIRSVPDAPPQANWNHIAYLPQIKQALGGGDYKYLAASAASQTVSRVRKDRQQVALAYLIALRTDFQTLLRTARIIAALSPQVAVAQELQGVRLNLAFSFRYYLIYFQLRTGVVPFNIFKGLSELLSALHIQMETAVREIGENSALPDITSSFNGGGLTG